MDALDNSTSVRVWVRMRGRRLVPGASRMYETTIAKVYLFRFDENLITNEHITDIPNVLQLSMSRAQAPCALTTARTNGQRSSEHLSASQKY